MTRTILAIVITLADVEPRYHGPSIQIPRMTCTRVSGMVCTMRTLTTD